jgi:hypothetical protein
MTVSDSPPRRPIETQTVRPNAAQPEIIYTEVHDAGSAAAWWVGGMVAVVAILAVVFLVARNPNTDAQVANAVEQGRLQGALEASQSSMAETQNAARQAAASANVAASNTAIAADSAKQAAQSAGDATSNASATVPAAQ